MIVCPTSEQNNFFLVAVLQLKVTFVFVFLFVFLLGFFC